MNEKHFRKQCILKTMTTTYSIDLHKMRKHEIYN